MGEYLPSVRTLDRDDKRKALALRPRGPPAHQRARSEGLHPRREAGHGAQRVRQVTSIPRRPLPPSKPPGRWPPCTLPRSKTAAVAGDQATVNAELEAAAQIILVIRTQTFADRLFTKTERAGPCAGGSRAAHQHRKNYRQTTTIACVSLPPRPCSRTSRNSSARSSPTCNIETAIIQAQEIEKRGDFAGAWESAKKSLPDVPRRQQAQPDPCQSHHQGSRLRAAPFVRRKRWKEKISPDRASPGYLKAQKEYQPSEFAKQGISRLTKEILPDATVGINLSVPIPEAAKPTPPI